MKKTIGLSVVAILIVAGLYLRYGRRPDPLPEDLQSARMLERGPHPVGSLDVTLTDSTRRTRAYGDFAGSDRRTLETTVWYPADLVATEDGPAPRPLPLAIYSHGFMSRRTGGAYLAEHLASHGYLVAAMDYPLSGAGAPDGPLIGDVVAQPGDVRFLIDRFLRWHREPGHRFEGAVDEDRIAVLGLSLGGLTTTLAAFHPRLGDPRIDAAVSIAGPTFMFGPRFFESAELPFLMLATDTDAIVDYGANARSLEEKAPGALLVTIEGGSHTGFADPARHMRFLDNPDGLGCWAVTSNLEGRSDPWWQELGSPEEGILPAPAPPLCQTEPLPEAMNPLQQHRLTLLAVTAFLQSHFADRPRDRARHRAYLTGTLPRELPAVSVRGGL